MNKKATSILKSQSENSIFGFMNIQQKLLLLFSALMLLVCLSGFSVPDNKKEISSYTDHLPTELKIKMKAGETHHYSIYLNAGEFAQIKATQYNIV